MLLFLPAEQATAATSPNASPPASPLTARRLTTRRLTTRRLTTRRVRVKMSQRRPLRHLPSPALALPEQREELIRRFGESKLMAFATGVPIGARRSAPLWASGLGLGLRFG